MKKIKEEEFMKEYETLCAKYNLHIVSEDPYCGVEVTVPDAPDVVDTDAIEYILSETEDAYMRSNYSDNHWEKIAGLLLEVEGANKEGVACVLNSKHMRWTQDFTGNTTLSSFHKYYNTDRNDVLKDLLDWSSNPY